jgi:hypothetical protein
MPDMAALEAQLGMKPADMMAALMARPDMLAVVAKPEVQAALADVAKSPWKVGGRV